MVSRSASDNGTGGREKSDSDAAVPAAKNNAYIKMANIRNSFSVTHQSAVVSAGSQALVDLLIFKSI